jgi:hypothetical protein
VVGGLLSAVRPATSDHGADGRLTVLLLGSDKRADGSISGERLDVILVASLGPDGRVAMASVPRDTVRFPRAAVNGGGNSGTARVNTLYATYRASCPGGADEKRACGLDRFRSDVEVALDLDIDRYAYIRFEAFDALLNEIEGIVVDTPGRIVDKGFMDEATPPTGVWFPDAVDYPLGGTGPGAPNCLSWKAADPACHRAIVYVRSRKGTEGSHNNSDYRRSLRQHGVVMGAIDKVLARGDAPGGPLDDLLAAVAGEAATGMFATDIPLTWAEALALYAALRGATLGPKAVFAPTKFSSVYGSATIKLKLAVVRDWVDRKITTVGPTP